MYHTSDFDFELPPELIASHPLEKRDASRMLVVGCKFPSIGGVPNGRGGGKKDICLNLPKNSTLKQRAAELRKAGSLPEALLWKEIKGKQINGFDFDRQHVIGNYIVDFFCAEKRFIVEIDDKSHDMKVKYDEKREKYLQNLGLQIMHVSAEDVLKNPGVVAQWIRNVISNTPTSALRATPPTEGNFVLPLSQSVARSIGGVPNGRGVVLADKHIRDFLDYLEPGDVVVFNNSRVIPARFMADGHEITLHTAVTDKDWWGLCRKFNKIKIGDILTATDGTKIKVLKNNMESGLLLHFDCDNVFSVLDKIGKMPLPPYMKREEETADRERYQTVYAEPLGSMAAPTAGLHFTDELMKQIEERGAKIVKVTLHVGAGTWMPVKTEDLSQHKMHSEWCCITPEQADIINNATRVIAVGTTSMRTLESAHKLALSSPLARGVARSAGVSYSPCARRALNGPAVVYKTLPQNLKLKQRAAELRKAGSLPEALLWNEIKNKKINGLNFNRQTVIGNYIVDFFCPKTGLVIEIDDKTHTFKEKYDEKRENFLLSLGLTTIHLSAKEVLQDISNVIEFIKRHPGTSCHPSSQRGTCFGFHDGNKYAKKDSVPRVLPICQTTDIFITPGYKFGAVDVLLTNFHLPKSTLFMLVSAFAGLDEMKAAYAHAVSEKYRFFSYGDCCLLFKKDE